MAKVGYLPERKRQEIERIVRIIRDGFSGVVGEQGDFGEAGIRKIFLCGSHARTDWREDWEPDYWSDYDILVLVDRSDFADPEIFWPSVRQALLDELRSRCSVDLTVASVEVASNPAERAQAMLSERLRDGVILFERPDIVELSGVIRSSP